MNCNSFIPALVSPSGGGESGGGGGTTNYDQLSNRPVQNISGDPVVISTLTSGVYNIDGSWVITADDKPKATYKDDMFYVLNEDGICKMTWITAGEIYTYSSTNGGDASSVEEDRVTKESDCKDHIGSGEGITNPDDLIGNFNDSGSSAEELPNWFGSF